MLGILVGLACAHTPHFLKKSNVKVDPEPSQALYMRDSATFTVDYRVNDPMLIVILLPYKPGFRSSATTVKNVSVVASPECTAGVPTAATSHNKYSPPGEVSDEPWAGGSYKTAVTVVAEKKANVSQSCVVEVTASSQYVFVVGTKEDIAEAMLVGLPYYVTMVSSWNDNYVYGDALLATVFVACVVIACVPSFERRQALLLNAVLLATVINRAFQYEPVGWGRLGAGLAWITMPIAAMALVLWGFSEKQSVRRELLTTLVLFILPTKSWIDVIVAAAFCFYNIVQRREEKNERSYSILNSSLWEN